LSARFQRASVWQPKVAATFGCLVAGRFQRLAAQAKNTGKFLNLLQMGRLIERLYSDQGYVPLRCCDNEAEPDCQKTASVYTIRM
jgi:hypothetical protein